MWKNIYEGRMNRSRFILVAPVTFVFPFMVAFLILKACDFEHSTFETGLPLGMLVFAVTVVVYLVLVSIPVVRRLNDAGMDRGFVGLLLIPALNVLLLIYLMFAPRAKAHGSGES